MVRYRAPYYKRRVPYRRRYGYRSRFPMRMYRDIRYLKSVVNPECKRIGYTATGVQITDTGDIVALYDVATGTGNTSRIGLSILPRWTTFDFSASYGAAASCTVRFMMFQWLDDSQPTAVTDVLQYATPWSELQHFNAGNKVDRTIRVLFDRKYTLTNSTASQTRIIKCVRDVNPQKMTRKFHCKYDGNNTGDYAWGQVYMLFISDVGVNYPTFSGRANSKFYDN